MVKRAAKTCNLFAALLLNKLSSDVTRFTTNESNLSCSKAGCIVMQKVESSYTSCNRICSCCAYFTGPRQTCFATNDVNPAYGVTPAKFYPIRSQYSGNFIRCKTGLNTGSKTRNIAFQHVLQECCETGCTFLLPVLSQL